METSRDGSASAAAPWPGASVHHKERTLSTMDDARALARAGCPSGTVATADYQEKGKGRVPGRTWISPPGESLLATVVLRISELGFDIGELPLRAGLAIALGIEEEAGSAVEIKWPNDILAAQGLPSAGKKIAGILCQADGQTALVGFGINLSQASFPDEIARTACSLFQLCGRVVPAAALLSAILVRLRAAVTHDAWQEAVRSRLHGRGRMVSVNPVGSGHAVQGILLDIDDRGRLVLGLSDGRRQTVAHGELSTSP